MRHAELFGKIRPAWNKDEASRAINDLKAEDEKLRTQLQKQEENEDLKNQMRRNLDLIEHHIEHLKESEEQTRREGELRAQEMRIRFEKSDAVR